MISDAPAWLRYRQHVCPSVRHLNWLKYRNWIQKLFTEWLHLLAKRHRKQIGNFTGISSDKRLINNLSWSVSWVVKAVVGSSHFSCCVVVRWVHSALLWCLPLGGRIIRYTSSVCPSVCPVPAVNSKTELVQRSVFDEMISTWAVTGRG